MAQNPIVSLSEFTYKRGTEIFGEKEPAQYVYQVKTGAVRSYKPPSGGGDRSARFTWPVIFLGWGTGERIDLLQKQSSIPLFV